MKKFLIIILNLIFIVVLSSCELNICKHEDKDYNHECDKCKAFVCIEYEPCDNHRDDNKNHFCDVCHYYFGHRDDDLDTYCDTCEEQLEVFYLNEDEIKITPLRISCAIEEVERNTVQVISNYSEFLEITLPINKYVITKDEEKHKELLLKWCNYYSDYYKEKALIVIKYVNPVSGLPEISTLYTCLNNLIIPINQNISGFTAEDRMYIFIEIDRDILEDVSYNNIKLKIQK